MTDTGYTRNEKKAREAFFDVFSHFTPEDLVELYFDEGVELNGRIMIAAYLKERASPTVVKEALLYAQSNPEFKKRHDELFPNHPTSGKSVDDFCKRP